jgi:predicted metal-dependent phosphoesterase TrpH
MRRRGLLIVTGAALALALGLASVLPPAARDTGAVEDARVMRGVLHVHSARSDGAGTVDEIARAAGRAGLHFVIITDHGDGTRAPLPPRYIDGVLCLDGVEISTAGGHYLALGLPQAPYRLAGEPRDVVEDVHRLGGLGIVAHAASPKAELRWREWTAPFDGLEWLNADSEWRDEPRRHVIRSLLTYWLRSPETIASLFDRPASVLARWDALAERRPVIAVAGQDAHARIGARGNWEPADRDVSLRVPSYEAAFRAFALRVGVKRRTGDAAADASQLLAGLRAGHVYTVIDAFARPAPVTFTATGGGSRAIMGDALPSASDVLIEAAVPAARGVVLQLIRDGRAVAAADGNTLRYVHQASARRAVYRLEAFLQDAPGTPQFPWIVTNPIYVGPPAPVVTVAPPPATAQTRDLLAPGGAWAVEHSADSRADLAVDAGGGVPSATLAFGLDGRAPHGQYAALRLPIVRGALASWSRLRFQATADRQMRVSVQLRDPQSGRRWIRSVVLGPQPREILVAFSDMTPVESTLDRQVRLDAVDSVLFVVDTTHSLPGDTGRVTITDLRAERTATR